MIKMKWSKEKIIDELKNATIKIGHSPSFKELIRLRGWDLPTVCYRYFGTFNNAKLIAGLVTDEKSKAYELPETAKNMTQELGYILGVIYGDGWIDIQFGKIGLNVKDKDFAEFFAKVLEKWCGKKATIKKVKLYHVRLYGTRIASFLKNYDVMKVLSSSEEVKGMFLRGLFDSEGYMAGYNLNNLRIAIRKIVFYNSNKKLVDMVIKLLQELGITKVKVSSNRYSGFGSKKKQYRVIIYGRENFEVFQKKIGFSINRKREKLKEVLKSYTKYK